MVRSAISELVHARGWFVVVHHGVMTWFSVSGEPFGADGICVDGVYRDDGAWLYREADAVRKGSYWRNKARADWGVELPDGSDRIWG